MQDMNLLIDIGNTNTNVAIASGKRIVKKYFIRTDREHLSRKAMRRMLGRHSSAIKRVVIVSVVPAFLATIKKTVGSILPKRRILIVGKDIKVPIRNNYKKPRQVGQDRLVTSFAALKLFGKPVLAIDFGSAVTFDYVSGKGAYEGGLIFPGIRLALSSLSENTALLPRVDIAPSKGLLGKDTRASINNGTIYGYAAVCDGLIERLKAKYSRSLKVVATGGDASLIARYSRRIEEVYPDLIISGLCLMLEDIR